MADTTNKPKQMEAYDKFEVTSEGYTLHDDAYCNGEVEETICDNPIQELMSCTFCATKIEKIENETFQESMHRDYCLWYCQNCRFWQARLYSAFRACMPPPDNWAYISKLREFDTNLPEGCETELALHIRRHPDLLHFFNPRRFEKFVADVFRANYTNAEVLHVGKPGDGGIDVLLIEARGEQWLIQVKRRGSQKSSEGVSTIRDILGAMVVKGVRKGIVVSTVERFSPNARQDTVKAKTGPFGMTVELVDKDIFNKMLDPILPDRPWLDPISEVDEGICNYLADRIPSDNQLDLFESQPFQLI